MINNMNKQNKNMMTNQMYTIMFHNFISISLLFLLLINELFTGRGCDPDMNVAYEYMKKGCNLGDARGCTKAGIMATSPNTKYEEDRTTEISIGLNMLKKSCYEHEQEQGCFFLSTIYLGALKPEVEINLREAYKLSLKSCEMGNPYACANVSQMHARGEGAQKNQSLADIFKKRATELHSEMKEAKKQLEFGQGIKT